MIRSEHKTFGFWFSIVAMCFFLLLFITALCQYYLGFKIIPMQIRSHTEFLFQVITPGVAVLIFMSILWFCANKISVDTDKKIISFQNVFTKNNQQYDFAYFDGFVDTFSEHENVGKRYKTIGLVKDKKIIRRIDSYYYSNYDDLRSAFQEFKYLGELDFNLVNRIKMLLRLEVIP